MKSQRERGVMLFKNRFLVIFQKYLGFLNLYFSFLRSYDTIHLA